MESKKLTLFVATCTAIILYALIGTTVSASPENSSNTFSFRFENCTVADALREISAKSGINIISNGTLKKEIFRKSYTNRHLDSIIKDLLRGENCAVVWNYSEGNLHTIDLYTFDENGLKRTGDGSTAINRSGRDNNRSLLPGNRDIGEINQIRNRHFNNSSRSNTTSSASRTSVNKNTSRKTNTANSAVYGTVKRTNTGGNTASGTSSVSANIRRATINNKNSEADNETEEEEEVINTVSPPETPEPEIGSGLERPPMPPGL